MSLQGGGRTVAQALVNAGGKRYARVVSMFRAYVQGSLSSTARHGLAVGDQPRGTTPLIGHVMPDDACSTCRFDRMLMPIVFLKN